MSSVYRIQDKQGRGPFRPGITVKWLEDRPDHDNLKPYFVEWPGFDPRREIQPGESCGVACNSPEELRRWFTKSEYQRLLILGYKAVKLRADRILRSSNVQCVFTRRKPLRKGAKEFRLYE